MVWEFWIHLEGQAGTVRAPLLDMKSKEPIEFEGELLDAMTKAAEFVLKYKDSQLFKVTGIEVIPLGRGKHLQYPSDDHGRLEEPKIGQQSA